MRESCSRLLLLLHFTSCRIEGWRKNAHASVWSMEIRVRIGCGKKQSHDIGQLLHAWM